MVGRPGNWCKASEGSIVQLVIRVVSSLEICLGVKSEFLPQISELNASRQNHASCLNFAKLYSEYVNSEWLRALSPEDATPPPFANWDRDKI